MEAKVKSNLEVKSTLEEKKESHKKHQACHAEIANEEAQVDDVNEKSQGLLQNTSDSRLTSQLTQLNSRYSALVTASKVCKDDYFLCQLIFTIDNWSLFQWELL